MKVILTRYFRNMDWVLVLIPLILVSIGILELYSIALGSGNPEDFNHFIRQILFSIAGLVVYFAVSIWLDYRMLQKLSMPLYVITVIILILVLIAGKTVRGTTGWFTFAGFNLQPIEFAKIALVIFLAKYLTYKAKYIQKINYLISSFAGVFLLVLLVLLQPDFGSAMILLAIWFALILVTGIRRSHLLILLAALAGALLISWFFIFAPYQKERIKVFMDPSLDPLGRGYNVSQAIIAVGSGQIFGRGVGFGSQSQLKFLPEAQTDFMFAVIAEELGLVGVILVVGLFAVLFWRIALIARQARDNFAVYITLGLLIVMFVQMAIIVGGNLGLLPVTGVPLPFVSYGGSSLLASMLALGLIQGIAMRRV